ncbi:hypothetical protein PILCRDRAFT_820409 [Piloderma croceum F 1598]|uniref:Uncharacterized protein n=1 Tax=Piloderma croceum (strain F 1598) TaxID=765440 RepID=A0A0C3FUH8_PILCF|nr:hypothetical protein PILCRDRAFT_820409 [Piloderma croceum F 1598]
MGTIRFPVEGGQYLRSRPATVESKLKAGSFVHKNTRGAAIFGFSVLFNRRQRSYAFDTNGPFTSYRSGSTVAMSNTGLVSFQRCR